MTAQTLTPRPQIPALVAFLVLSLAVGAIGGWATASSVETWYPTLAKPAFNPPNAVFGPVWTGLYILMAVAAWRVWRAGEGPLRSRAMVLYGVQLALNLAWSLLFFGARSPLLALIEIVVLLALILAAARAFWRIDKVAGALMAPYALWVTFATALNFEIWRLN